jgi:hypothetical protein
MGPAFRLASSGCGQVLRSGSAACRAGRFRSFDLTFESHRSTHTILKYLAALWEMPSLLDSQGVFECKEAVRQPHH